MSNDHDPDSDPGPDGRLLDSTTARSRSYQHRCEFCEHTVEASTIEDVRTDGCEHLETQHYDEFVTHLSESEGVTCRGGCGGTFSPATVDGFDCPSCGYDNFPHLSDQHVWWRMEVA